jgi:hypothetical protein
MKGNDEDCNEEYEEGYIEDDEESGNDYAARAQFLPMPDHTLLKVIPGDNLEASCGEVIAVGSSSRHWPHLRVGTYFVFDHGVGTRIKVNGVRHIVIRNRDLLGVFYIPDDSTNGETS